MSSLEETDLIKNIRMMRQGNDYYDSQGFICCGTCNKRKQKDIKVNKNINSNGFLRVPILCDCQIKRNFEIQKRENEAEFLRRMERLRRDGVTDPQYLQFRFENDDKKDIKISKVCRKYVDNWDEIKRENIGILFSGTIGTGKSFFACCIANALIEKLVPACVTNFPRILNKLQNFASDKQEDKQEFIDKLQRYELLVIDDLGVERDTPYTLEQIYNIIDTRSRSNNPTLFTTNLTIEQMEKVQDMQYKRIYDRVLSMCPIRLNMCGASRRIDNALKKQKIARQIIRGDGNG